MVDPNRLPDYHDIQQLKARYFLLTDAKRWGELRQLLTNDVTVYVGDVQTADGVDALLAYFESCNPDRVTVHQGHMPIIEFTNEDAASGIWAIFNWVDDPSQDSAFQGFGHSHDRYVRDADGLWRIRESRLQWIRIDPVAVSRRSTSP